MRQVAGTVERSYTLDARIRAVYEKACSMELASSFPMESAFGCIDEKIKDLATDVRRAIATKAPRSMRRP